jgi:hypothetical protein
VKGGRYPPRGTGVEKSPSISNPVAGPDLTYQKYDDKATYSWRRIIVTHSQMIFHWWQSKEITIEDFNSYEMIPTLTET